VISFGEPFKFAMNLWVIVSPFSNFYFETNFICFFTPIAKLVTAMASPLAAAGVSIFNLSTYETDYVLVPESKLYDALDAMNKEFTILTEGLEDIEKEVPRPNSPLTTSNNNTDTTITKSDSQEARKFKLTLPSHNLYLVGVRKEMVNQIGQNMLRMLLFPQE
jgi:hypothetical protein